MFRKSSMILKISNYATLALLVMISWGMSGYQATAAGDEMTLDCSQTMQEANSELSCRFRLVDPQQPEKLILSVNGQDLTDIDFKPFISGNHRSAWLFLIDRSNPKRAATVKRNVDLVRSQLRNSSVRRLMGVATFASSLDVVLEPSASHDNLDDRLNQIQADGLATEYFSNTLAAIGILAKINADRKALVIMSDGKAEDTAYTREDAVKAAKAAGVVIIGLGYAETETDTPALQKVRRLAEETNGQFASAVGSKPVSSQFLSDLNLIIENGGTVRGMVPADLYGDAKIELSVKTSTNNTLTGSQTMELAQIAPPPEPEKVVAPEPEPAPLPLIGQIYSVFGENSGLWAAANPALAWLFLVLIPLIAIAAIVFALKKSDENHESSDLQETPATSTFEGLEDAFPEEDDGVTRVVASDLDSANHGYFEVVGSEETRYEIDAQSISIGRHSDNDIQLNNDTVHRHHAHFFISPDGLPTLKDLDTVNGIFVGGNRISSVTLQSGDMIELGEVRLRYVSYDDAD